MVYCMKNFFKKMVPAILKFLLSVVVLSYIVFCLAYTNTCYKGISAQANMSFFTYFCMGMLTYGYINLKVYDNFYVRIFVFMLSFFLSKVIYRILLLNNILPIQICIRKGNHVLSFTCINQSELLNLKTEVAVQYLRRGIRTYICSVIVKSQAPQ